MEKHAMNIDWTDWGGWLAAGALALTWIWRHTSAVRRMALFEGRTMTALEKIAKDLDRMGKEMRSGFAVVHDRIDKHLENTIARKEPKP